MDKKVQVRAVLAKDHLKVDRHGENFVLVTELGNIYLTFEEAMDLINCLGAVARYLERYHNALREAEGVSNEELEAAATIYDDLVAGTHYEKQEAAEKWIKNLGKAHQTH